MIVLALVSAIWFHDNAKFVELSDREFCEWGYEGYHQVESNFDNHLLINDQFAIWTQYCND